MVIVVLWMMVILSLAAAGLARSLRAERMLVKTHLGKMRSRQAVLSGVMYARSLIRQDSADLSSQGFDTRYQCGFSLPDGEAPEHVFGRQGADRSFFEMGAAGRAGFSDEDGKINLNALTPANSGILAELITLGGGEEGMAARLSFAVVDRKDEDEVSAGSPESREEPAGKNRPFDAVEELMMVEGMTPEIFDRLKNFVTVFPRQGRLRINFDTAEEPVLAALARFFAGPANNASQDDADGLVRKIVEFRRGADGNWGTGDDPRVDGRETPLNARESALWTAMARLRTPVSRHLVVRIKGVDEDTGIFTSAQAVIERHTLAVVDWRRDEGEP
ncbi:MAG: type II secretion system protein GspK [Candidatus Omnitrophota bacterium]|nr:type II secretion system protein GspK [Candidatus Omnitrophota bacterium]MDZ4241367.1 type II secretion system protein GspK [Candidatus Omnitrophota bacterium]